MTDEMSSTTDNANDTPLNATEHIVQTINRILEELEKRDGQYDWDPATFFITMVIGIIAIFFAGLASS